MKEQTRLVLFCLFTSLITVAIPDESFRVSDKLHHRGGNLKLFVFGDSYVDGGNWPKSYGRSWEEPSGITFPGYPSGRFSDGRVLSDYIAGILGTKSPITYRAWKSGEKKSTKYGMNFAYGGTGVFNTPRNLPNMTTQIDYFQQFAQRKLHLLINSTSIAVICVAGNDYLTSNRSYEEFTGLTKPIINQLILNIKRMHGLGVQKIGVTAMEPVGCLPQFTASTSYQNCNEILNSVAKFHNQVLVESVRKLNNERDDKSPVVILDLYKSFSSSLNLHQNLSAGNLKLETLLKPCCIGVTNEYSCGMVEEGTNIVKYDVCENPSDSFFWDIVHPSQHGWHVVTSYLRSSILQLR